MPARRYTHSNPAPQLTTTGDTYLPPCTGRSEPYDVLIDHRVGPNHDRALRAAKEICATCPLAVMTDCFRRNADEPWVMAMLGRRGASELVKQAKREKALAYAAERRAERLAELRDLIDLGADLDEVLQRLHITRDGLWQWCKRNGYLDLWNQINQQVAA